VLVVLGVGTFPSLRETMKHYLFIDNFRGFSDTFVPITEVNFLVGENRAMSAALLELSSGDIVS